MYNKTKQNDMNKEFLYMQKLAGLITESEYAAKLEEANQLPLTPEQQKTWEEAMVKQFARVTKAEDETEALYDLPISSGNILANILSGFKPLEDRWSDEGDWYMEPGDDEDLSHPYNKLTQLGYDISDIEKLAGEMYNRFVQAPTNNPNIKNIQSWYKANN